MNNHKIYANEELQSWIERDGLIEQERYLIDKYIKNKGKLLEAGTGGGRISIEIKKRFKDIDIVAFDFVEDMIKAAKKKDDKIDFVVADASDLSIFECEIFDFAIYLQQIISLLPYELISNALDEAFRVLKSDGIIIFSFLNYNSRKINPILSKVVNTARFFRGEKIDKKLLPWLKLAGKPNYKFLAKDQALTYWFDENEVKTILTQKGFKICEILNNGMIYAVCKK